MHLERLRPVQRWTGGSTYSRDIDDWRITFVDTGLQATIGQRLRAVQKYLDGESWFLANYSDGLSDLPLPEYLEYAQSRDRIATFVCVRPNQSFHVVSMDPSGMVNDIQSSRESQFLVNGGFFALKSQIFDYIGEGEELVEEPFRRLIDKGDLAAYRYDGFWGAMDTLKDKQSLEQLHETGTAPWQVWDPSRRVDDDVALAAAG